ncbi:MAG: SCP2 sterol-binding domain-containing protein [Promethearchaeota archaeon]
MVKINDPEDIMGMGLKNILGYRLEDPKFQRLATDWNRTVVVEIKGIYSVTVKFEGDEIVVTPETGDKYHLKFTIDLPTMVDIGTGKVGAVKAFLKGRVKVKKIWRVGTLLRFMKIFIPALKLAGERAKHFKIQKARTSNYQPAIEIAEGGGFL